MSPKTFPQNAKSNKFLRHQITSIRKDSSKYGFTGNEWKLRYHALVNGSLCNFRMQQLMSVVGFTPWLHFYENMTKWHLRNCNSPININVNPETTVSNETQADVRPN